MQKMYRSLAWISWWSPLTTFALAKHLVNSDLGQRVAGVVGVTLTSLPEPDADNTQFAR